MNGRPPNNGPQGPDQPAYTIPGILNFIKHEWTRFEKERANWDAEKTELQVRTTVTTRGKMVVRNTLTMKFSLINTNHA